MQYCENIFFYLFQLRWEKLVIMTFLHQSKLKVTHILVEIKIIYRYEVSIHSHCSFDIFSFSFSPVFGLLRNLNKL